MTLISMTDNGLFCPIGNFYIDPYRGVGTAVITHAHADHAKTGSESYITNTFGVPILKKRLGSKIKILGLNYGESRNINSVKVSLHPAGHILGSSQVRLEFKNEVVVVTGDYKRAFDQTCKGFQSLQCDTLITESTFAHPIYNWPSFDSVIADIYDWWHCNRKKKITSILFAYSLGKTQRILAGLSEFTNDTVLLHGAAVELTQIYREAGVRMLPTVPVSQFKNNSKFDESLVIAPPSAFRSPWLKKFKEYRTGFCSGWMLVRGNRRRNGYDRGFVISDHADWNGLVQTIKESNAKNIVVTHGRSDILIRYLKDISIKANHF
tara:strand:- start:601 stop:1566 length:966 start_codon:yes stop_codon:yes gene_type:complete